MTLDIFLNIFIIALLIIGIIYAIVLEYRLSTAKESKRELSLLIEHFYKASQKIAEELALLSELEKQAQTELKINLDCAKSVQAELTTLMIAADEKITVLQKINGSDTTRESTPALDELSQEDA